METLWLAPSGLTKCTEGRPNHHISPPGGDDRKRGTLTDKEAGGEHKTHDISSRACTEAHGVHCIWMVAPSNTSPPTPPYPTYTYLHKSPGL
ncbi:unnamed protein product [Lota lota]